MHEYITHVHTYIRQNPYIHKYVHTHTQHWNHFEHEDVLFPTDLYVLISNKLGHTNQCGPPWFVCPVPAPGQDIQIRRKAQNRRFCIEFIIFTQMRYKKFCSGLFSWFVCPVPAPGQDIQIRAAHTGLYVRIRLGSGQTNIYCSKTSGRLVCPVPAPGQDIQIRRKPRGRKFCIAGTKFCCLTVFGKLVCPVPAPGQDIQIRRKPQDREFCIAGTKIWCFRVFGELVCPVPAPGQDIQRVSKIAGIHFSSKCKWLLILMQNASDKISLCTSNQVSAADFHFSSKCKWLLILMQNASDKISLCTSNQVSVTDFHFNVKCKWLFILI